jgi:P-type Ca2+ transporter type 2C
MLWINLIMDTFAALALATEMPPDDILLRQPQSKDEPLITKVMWRNIIGHAVYQIIVISFMIFCYSNWLVYEYQQPCLQYATSLMQNCLLYDPFYTKDLYYT